MIFHGSKCGAAGDITFNSGSNVTTIMNKGTCAVIVTLEDQPVIAVIVGKISVYSKSLARRYGKHGT